MKPEEIEKIVNALFKPHEIKSGDAVAFTPAFIRTALADLDGDGTIPFDKAVDRASLNAFDRFEFIKGAKWAQEFLIKEYKPIELKNLKNPE